MQFLEYFSRTSELLHFHQIFTQSSQRLSFVLLSLLLNPLVELQQEDFCCLKLVLPHKVISPLQTHIDAERVYLFTLIHSFKAFRLCFALLQQISETNFGYSCVRLCNIAFDFCLWSSGFERIGDALPGSFYPSFEGLYGLNSMIDICKFHEAFVGASGHVLDVLFQDLLCLLLLLGHFEQVGVAHDQHFVMGIFGVGETVEVFSLLVLQGFVFLLCQPEQLLEGEFCE